MFFVKSRNTWMTAILCLLGVGTVSGGVREANEAFLEGSEAYKQKNYVQAADRYMAAKLYADDPAMKVKALQEAMNSYRAAGLREKEFSCVENLLNAYPGYIDYSAMVNREYEIGNDFFKGHRDPEYWSLRWIPWLTGGDLTQKIYEAALKHAPFSRYAPEAKLRIARLMIDNGKSEEALKQLRELIRNYPDSEARKYGYLELISALMYLARYGDGDGAYNREVNEVMSDFLRKYTNAPEGEWVKKRILEAKDINAQRLYDLAKYYNRIGRTDPAERYLGKVLRDYPDTLPADKSEKLLSSIDESFVPLKFRPKLESRYQSYKEEPLPAEGEPIMVAPECSNGKWLLPIRDLGMGGNNIKIERAKTGVSEKK